MLGFPFFTLEQLKAAYPSKAHGRGWRAELNYRQECISIILACVRPLKLELYTAHRAAVLLQRYFTREPSTACTGLEKWAAATACLFLATKIDSSYHRLESVAHVSFRALREAQGRPLEAEYYNPDGSPGNPAFLARLCQMVRDAELGVIFGLNFDFNVDVPASSVCMQLGELGLTEAAAAADPAADAVRKLAVRVAVESITAPRSVACLQHPGSHLALAAISVAAQHYGYPLCLRPPPPPPGKRNVTPDLSPEQLAAVVAALPSRPSSGSRPGTPAASNGADRTRDGGGGRTSDAVPVPAAAAAAPAAGAPGSGDAAAGGGAPAACVKAAAAGGAHLHLPGRSGSAGDGSAADAITAAPPLLAGAQSTASLSPSSETGPDAGASAVPGGRQQQRPGQQQQQQQQQQCTKRVREAAGALSADPPQKRGSMVAV